MEDCLICLNPLRSSRPRGPSELPCGHNFHRRCIEEWRQTSSTCPTCRHPLRPSTSPARRRPSTISSDGHFYVLLPPAFHIDAIAATHGFRLHHTRIGEIACFCCDGSVREQLRELQRISVPAAAADLVSASKDVLRNYFAHFAGRDPVVIDEFLAPTGEGEPIVHASMCAAACAVLGVPGFQLLDLQPRRLRGIAYAENAADVIERLEDPMIIFRSDVGFCCTVFSARDVLEVIPQLRDTIPEFLAAMEASRRRARAEGGGQLQPRARPAQLQARRYGLDALIMSRHLARHLPIVRHKQWRAAAVGILWLVIALAILCLGIYISLNLFDWYWYIAAKV